MYIYTINNQVIPDADILSEVKMTEKMTEDQNLIASELNIELNNIDRTKYDDRVEGSLFYGTDFYNMPVSIYDNVINIYIWKGLIKNLTVANNKIIVNTLNYVQQMAERTCVISSSTDKTPAEIIFTILTTVAGISADDINYKGFQEAINLQTANQLYVNCNFTITDNQTSMAVISELSRISNCNLYIVDNRIFMHPWTAWNGESGLRIKSSYVLEGSYSHTFSEEDKIYNHYNIAYDNSSIVAYATGSDTESISSYGQRDFIIPNKEGGVSSTASSAFKILIRNATGAAWVGTQTLSRYKFRTKVFNFKIKHSLELLRLNDIILLDFDSYYGEPALITERIVDRENRTIEFKGYFLNTPHEYYERDKTPPAKPELISALTEADGTVYLRWSANTETDFLGNKLYFTTTRGEWESEYCNQGKSPIDVKGSDLSYDGYRYYIIGNLNLDTEYYFKMTAYDTNLNESDFSNILSCTPTLGTGILYCLTGDPITSGLELDMINSMGGVLTNDDMLEMYGDHNYDLNNYAYTACYESPELSDRHGFNSITIKGYGDPNDIKFTYKDIETGLWSTPVDAVGNKTISLNGVKKMIYRILFCSENWTDTDRAYVMDLR